MLDRWQAPANARNWVGEECLWVNSLVDRIVSEPLEPLGAVAEPYALWAIEDQPGLELPCRHGAIVVAADLKPYERLKLFILNLGHTYLAELWCTEAARRPDGPRGGGGHNDASGTGRALRGRSASGVHGDRHGRRRAGLPQDGDRADSPIHFSITACPKSSPITRPRRRAALAA